MSWQVRPWAVQVQAGYQGQRWGLVLRGWPWDWQASVTPQGPASRVPSAYRLGEWSGQLALSGRGARCVSGQGALVADQLALVAPWTLALGRGEVRVVCNEGWRLSARLAAAGQHHLALDAGVAGGTLQGQVEQGRHSIRCWSAGSGCRPESTRCGGPSTGDSPVGAFSLARPAPAGLGAAGRSRRRAHSVRAESRSACRR
ncbi:hypothetical protein NWF32_30720 [Pseudomonas qingdaonensis]|nr:hypothetical protein [Pseudomonas qingdaonensis]